tara:strand:+ start:344 stop:1018 length:675 start_codon:yes stop_codon:yes gene_type:complete
MKRILCIGDSHTAGHNRHTTVSGPDDIVTPKNWSAYLQKTFRNSEVWNLSLSGSNNFFSGIILDSFLETYTPDVVIYQISDHRRFIKIKSTTKLNLLESTNCVAPNYYALQRRPFPFGMMVSPQSFASASRREINQLYTALSDDDIVYLNSIAVERNLLKLQNIPHYAFYWRKDDAVITGYDSVDDILGSQFHSFVEDNGCHLNTTGHGLVYNNIIHTKVANLL